MHRLRRGLQGYLIPFATHAFVPERQEWASVLPSPLVFLGISTDFTPTCRILHTSPILQKSSFDYRTGVEPRYLITNLRFRLRTLYAQ